MINAGLLLGSLMLLSASSCDRYPPPKTELCISGDNDAFQCNDMRRDEGEQDYDLTYPHDTLNYICTNPQDYKSLKQYCTDLRAELIKCKKQKAVDSTEN